MSIEMGGARADPAHRRADRDGYRVLGAGAIMRTGSGVQGLTTAATVWVNAAVGVAAGSGKYHLALLATGVTLAALLVLVPVERGLERFAARKGIAPRHDATDA
jgi:putative Mg2+ transporter-C (MgtC) family protein